MNNAKMSAPRAPHKPDTQTVVIRLHPEEVSMADEYALQDARSRASFIRLMFLRGVAEFERQHGIERVTT